MPFTHTATLDLRDFAIGALSDRDSGVNRYFASVEASGAGAEVVILDGEAATVRGRERFATEHEVARGTAHPSVVPWLGSGTVDPRRAATLDVPPMAPFFVLERPAGIPLSEAPAPTGWVELHALIDNVLGGLAALHGSGWIHSRLSASTLLVPRRGRPGGALITGLGNAQRSGGTVRVAKPGPTDAPEIGVRPGPVTPRTDMFGLGVAIFEHCVGELPFADTAASPPRLFKAPFAVRPSFYLWLSRMMALDPERRYGSIAEARSAWREVSGGVSAVPSPTVPPGQAPETGEHSRLHGTPLAAINPLRARASDHRDD